MKNRTFCFIVLCFVGMMILGCESQEKKKEKVKSIMAQQEATVPPDKLILSEFERSEFCRTYNCSFDRSWDLRSGGTNNSYDIDVNPTVSVEITTSNGKLTGGGLMFFERPKLISTDFQLVYSFLNSISSTAGLSLEVDSTIRRLVEQNIETNVFQIREANSIPFGSMRIWAGKVGKEQTISVEIDKDTNKPQKTEENQKTSAQLPIVTLSPYQGNAILFWERPGGGAANARVIDSMKRVVQARVLGTTMFTVPGTTRTYKWYHVECVDDGKKGWVMDTYVTEGTGEREP
ncbi:hypothetical protein FJZ31_12040 [Candidatus Poribacteria bacterium]|nr:hypothetical protein [Candidatus Poribacteria bacterium]